jgi:S-adenosylmethionine:tRNA ribosyltransferase-isomerase
MDIRRHRMHAEHYEISAAAADVIRSARQRGGRVVAIGTTALRALEDAALYSAQGQLEAGSRWTQIFIYPSFDFRVVDALVTNFHLPKSTLLMLVCAFADRERILEAYADAVTLNYRFYSFGDAMLAFRRV